MTDVGGASAAYAGVVPWMLIIVVGLLVWAGTTLLLDAWMKRQRRPSLAERSSPPTGSVMSATKPRSGYRVACSPKGPPM